MATEDTLNSETNVESEGSEEIFDSLVSVSYWPRAEVGCSSARDTVWGSEPGAGFGGPELGAA